MIKRLIKLFKKDILEEPYHVLGVIERRFFYKSYRKYHKRTSSLREIHKFTQYALRHKYTFGNGIWLDDEYFLDFDRLPNE